VTALGRASPPGHFAATFLTPARRQDIRRIVRNDGRIINKLHRRIFLDKITHDDAQIYLSFYVEASNRWALPRGRRARRSAGTHPGGC
jgi:hypothetical protein